MHYEFDIAPPDAETKQLYLEDLRRVCVEAPDDRLHMKHFCEVGAACGTAYCLAGFAAIDERHSALTPIREVFRVTPSTVRPGDLYVDQVAQGKTTEGLAAVYGLDYDDAAHLFATYSSGDYPGLGPHDITKAEVLERIDLALAGMPIPPYDAMPEDEDDDEDNDNDGNYDDEFE